MVLHPSLSSASSQHSLIDLSVISAIFIVHVVLLRPLPLLPETLPSNIVFCSVLKPSIVFCCEGPQRRNKRGTVFVLRFGGMWP